MMIDAAADQLFSNMAGKHSTKTVDDFPILYRKFVKDFPASMDMCL